MAKQAPQKRLRALVPPTVTLVAIALLGVFLWNRRDELDTAFSASSGGFAALVALTVVGQLLNATEYWVLYRGGGVRVGWVDSTAAFNAGQLGNYLPLQAGSVYRLHFMKAVHGVRYPRSITVYAQNLVITIAAGGVVALVGVTLTPILTAQPFSWVMFGVSGAMLAVAVIFAVVPLPHAPWLPGRLEHWWRDFHTGWDLARREPRPAFAVMVIEVLREGVMALRLMLAFSLLGIHVPFSVCLVLAPVASISTMLSFTPGAIGVREAAIAAAALAMGVTFSTGVLAASVDRGASLIVTTTLGAIGYLVTSRRLRAVRRAAPSSEELAGNTS